MENKMTYTSPEISVVELNTEDIVLISIDSDRVGEIEEVSFESLNTPLY